MASPDANTPVATTDVIVVGAGGSGLAAAVSALEYGLQVLVLERLEQVGGTTGLAVGSFTANRTSLQRRNQIDDSATAHADDAGQFAPAAIEACNNPQLRQFFLQESSATLEWLIKKGIVFHGPYPEPPNRVQRMHNAIPGGRAYISALQREVERLGGSIKCGAKVTRLIQQDGRVTGVEVETHSGATRWMANRAVVLAAGDYAAAGDLLSRFKGPEFSAVDSINPHATGDGQRLVESVGGELKNMPITYGPELRFVPPEDYRSGWWDRLPARGPLAAAIAWLTRWMPAGIVGRFAKRVLVTWQHPEDSLFEDGAILVNREGQRFCDERRSPERELAIAALPDRAAYILLDQKLLQRYSRWPHFISTAPQIAYAYIQDYLRLRPDVARQADSLDRLAQSAGIAPAPLRTTVQNYNADQSDPQLKLNGDKWALLGPVRAYFTTTEGGAAIDQQLRVLTPAGQPIPGLFAVGQNGLGGMILWGHGLHIAWAITSGRLVGAAIADAAKDAN